VATVSTSATNNYAECDDGTEGKVDGADAGWEQSWMLLKELGVRDDMCCVVRGGETGCRHRGIEWHEGNAR
jgi:hypothetical protein